MNDRLKKLIFDKLYMNLSHAEVIECGDTIWVIDRENKYWYLEYAKSGKLWWRLQFFHDFFPLFSMEEKEYVPIIIEWAEEVLNRKITTSKMNLGEQSNVVDIVLNCNNN